MTYFKSFPISKAVLASKIEVTSTQYLDREIIIAPVIFSVCPSIAKFMKGA